MAQMLKPEWKWVPAANEKALTVEIPFLIFARSQKHGAFLVCRVSLSSPPAISGQYKGIYRLVMGAQGGRNFCSKMSMIPPTDLLPGFAYRAGVLL